jgi:hypothetical protein
MKTFNDSQWCYYADKVMAFNLAKSTFDLSEQNVLAHFRILHI